MKVAYTQKGGQLIENDPFLSFELEWTCLVLRDNTILGADVLNHRPEIDSTRDHMGLGIPARINGFDHMQRLDLGSNTRCMHLFKKAGRVVDLVCKSRELSSMISRCLLKLKIATLDLD